MSISIKHPAKPRDYFIQHSDSLPRNFAGCLSWRCILLMMLVGVLWLYKSVQNYSSCQVQFTLHSSRVGRSVCTELSDLVTYTLEWPKALITLNRLRAVVKVSRASQA